ncbi:MAG TPA: CDP-alcohol phosphatidyltransferase family protein [Acidimicrobiia bacterium]|jgi:phosphatidylcholine synthase
MEHQLGAHVIEPPRPPVYTQREIRAGWILHVFTASGVIVGMLGLESIVEGHARAAILWLVVAMLMDGIDGPIARKINVRHAIPHIDGNTLDLIVDYFTCTIVPVAFLDKFDMLPDNTIALTGFVILLTGALWMARTDMETEDRWFRGFPAEWNVIIPTLFLLNANEWFNLAICASLCVLTTMHVEFPHPVSVREKRPMSLLAMTVWIGAMVTLAIEQERQNRGLRLLLVLAPLWTAYMVIDRARRNRASRRSGVTSAAASAPQ